MPDAPTTEWLTIGEFARRHGVHRVTVSRWLAEDPPRIECKRLGRTVRIPATELERLAPFKKAS